MRWGFGGFGGGHFFGGERFVAHEVAVERHKVFREEMFAAREGEGNFLAARNAAYAAGLAQPSAYAMPPSQAFPPPPGQGMTGAEPPPPPSSPAPGPESNTPNGAAPHREGQNHERKQHDQADCIKKPEPDPKVLAEQEKWNKEHPDNKISVDGIRGPETEASEKGPEALVKFHAEQKAKHAAQAMKHAIPHGHKQGEEKHCEDTTPSPQSIPNVATRATQQNLA